MTSYQFEFRYESGDVRLIRESLGVALPSPGTSMSVWAMAIAVCLLILGGLGNWWLLALAVACSAIFFVLYVRRISAIVLGQQDCLPRTVTISESGILERVGDSLSDRSWEAFEGVQDLPDHLLLLHYDKPTVIPKRAMGSDLNTCGKMILSWLGQNSGFNAAHFQEWFPDNPTQRVYKFRWQDQDFELLKKVRMREFDPLRLGTAFANSSRPSAILQVFTYFLLLAFFLWFWFISKGVLRIDLIFNGMLSLIAVALPFIVAAVWWQFTTRLIRERRPRVPDEEIFVSLDESALLIGYPKAVARYSFNDIQKFYYSEDFIGFRPGSGLVHVIAAHAFGGRAEALEFLASCYHRRDSLAKTKTIKSARQVQAVETNNPYQPPAYG